MSWLDTHIYLPLIKDGFSPEYLNSISIEELIDTWQSYQDDKLINAAREWFYYTEMEIQREAKEPKTVEVGGKSVTVQPKSIDFVMREKRKEKYKGYF